MPGQQELQNFDETGATCFSPLRIAHKYTSLQWTDDQVYKRRWILAEKIAHKYQCMHCHGNANGCQAMSIQDMQATTRLMGKRGGPISHVAAHRMWMSC